MQESPLSVFSVIGSVWERRFTKAVVAVCHTEYMCMEGKCCIILLS